MSEQVDPDLGQSDEVASTSSPKPWTIKGIPADVRQAAITQADKSDQAIGEWMTLAIREKIKSDRNRGKSLAVKGAVVPVDLSSVGQVVTMLERLSAAGAPPPEHVQRSVYSVVTRCLTDIKAGRTMPVDGPTKTAQEGAERPSETPDAEAAGE